MIQVIWYSLTDLSLNVWTKALKIMKRSGCSPSGGPGHCGAISGENHRRCRNVTFKGVHYEILVETELRTYKVQTTDYAEVGRQVGLKFGPEDIHVMYRMGAY